MASGEALRSSAAAGGTQFDPRVVGAFTALIEDANHAPIELC
jgi:hypothetical protein